MNTNSEVELECLRVEKVNGPIALLFMAGATCGELRLTNQRVMVKAVFPSTLVPAVWMFGTGSFDISLAQIKSVVPFQSFTSGLTIQTNDGQTFHVRVRPKERRDALLVKIQAAMNALQQG